MRAIFGISHFTNNQSMPVCPMRSRSSAFNGNTALCVVAQWSDSPVETEPAESLSRDLFEFSSATQSDGDSSWWFIPSQKKKNCKKLQTPRQFVRSLWAAERPSQLSRMRFIMTGRYHQTERGCGVLCSCSFSDLSLKIILYTLVLTVNDYNVVWLLLCWNKLQYNGIHRHRYVHKISWTWPNSSEDHVGRKHKINPQISLLIKYATTLYRLL